MGSWYITVPVVVNTTAGHCELLVQAVMPSSQRPFVQVPGFVQVRVTVSGSWMPAETVPLVGAPATFGWQRLSVPVELYAKFADVLLSGGLKLALRCS